MSVGWIVACVILIVALYAWLFMTADALHASEQEAAQGLEEHAQEPIGTSTTQKDARH
jgi:hypothetical protein